MLYNKKRAAEPPQSLGHTVISLLLLLSAWKDEREAPKTCKSNEGKDDPCDEIRSAVKYRGNDVEIKKTDASPVQGADDGENKSYPIDDHKFLLLFFSWREIIVVYIFLCLALFIDVNCYFS